MKHLKIVPQCIRCFQHVFINANLSYWDLIVFNLSIKKLFSSFQSSVSFGFILYFGIYSIIWHFGWDTGYLFSQLHWRYLRHRHVSHFSEKHQDQNSAMHSSSRVFSDFKSFVSTPKMIGAISKRRFRGIYHEIGLSPCRVFNLNFTIAFVFNINFTIAFVFSFC